MEEGKVTEELQGSGEEKQKKIPVDTKLLSDAVIELNISRRSVGLYPREHPIVKESIERAFEFQDLSLPDGARGSQD
jgi:hypothetical protein